MDGGHRTDAGGTGSGALEALLDQVRRRTGYRLERLWYDPQAEKVTLRPLAAEKAEPVELEPLEFIARVVQHIPDVRERQVVYYGVYANASKRLPRRREGEGQGASAGTLVPLEEPIPYQQPHYCDCLEIVGDTVFILDRDRLGQFSLYRIEEAAGTSD